MGNDFRLMHNGGLGDLLTGGKKNRDSYLDRSAVIALPYFGCASSHGSKHGKLWPLMLFATHCSTLLCNRVTGWELVAR